MPKPPMRWIENSSVARRVGTDARDRSTTAPTFNVGDDWSYCAPSEELDADRIPVVADEAGDAAAEASALAVARRQLGGLVAASHVFCIELFMPPGRNVMRRPKPP